VFELDIMKNRKRNSAAGFSLIELVIAMTLILVVLALVSTLFSRSLTTRQRESSRTDALTAAQAALNVISREVANSGYGLAGNGLVLADSGAQQLHFSSNIRNDNLIFTDPGEDVTYFFDASTQSILRHDRNGGGINVSRTSILINRISSLGFQYFDYVGTSPATGPFAVPSVNTSRVRVTVRVSLEQLQGQVNPHNVVLTSDVALRNSDYMLRQY
jgi:prepilin-type N-terminal cleavage/methylation domain-containing protein